MLVEILRRVLITGAGGRVARRMRPFLSNKHEWVLSDIRKGSDSEEAFLPVDITDRKGAIAAFHGFDAVVHSAIASYKDEDYEPGSPDLYDYVDRMVEINLRGAYNVFEAARVCGVRRVVLMSSLTTVLGHDRESLLSEYLPPKPNGEYGCTKCFGEMLGEFYSRNHGLEVIVLRLGQPYPMGVFKEERWLEDDFCRGIFVSHQDIARAVEAALGDHGVSFGVYNVVGRNSDPVVGVSRGKEIGFEPKDSFHAPTPLVMAGSDDHPLAR